MAERVPGPGKCIPEFIKQIHHPVLLDTDDVQRQPGASEVCDQRANWLHQSAQLGAQQKGAVLMNSVLATSSASPRNFLIRSNSINVSRMFLRFDTVDSRPKSSATSHMPR